MSENPFQGFPKIPRLNRDIVITEKIDGTNAQIYITDTPGTMPYVAIYRDGERNLYMIAGSRSRYLTVENDNYGFARWVQKNYLDLFKLGDGRHYGEWWGQGLQRGYGLKEKRFSLFNTGRWNRDNKPECCHVVPVLYSGRFDTDVVLNMISFLKRDGSQAAPGFMNPEGVVVFHTAANSCFKVTCQNDDKYKGLMNE